MRDDVAPPNLGQCNRVFDAEFFWKTYRQIEQQWTRVLSKGPLNVSNLSADEVDADTMLVGGQPVATQAYVNAGDALKVSKSGDTMSGPLILSAPISTATQATTKAYVDAGDTAANNNANTRVLKAGDTMTGDLVMSGGGIRFPATPVLSANPNTLDDYEEGTFTPRFQGSTVAGVMTYTSQQGQYTKIGSNVFITLNMQVNTVSTAPTGSLAVTGLPFTLAAAQLWAAGSIGYTSLVPASSTGYGCMIDASFPIASTTQLRLNYVTSGGGMQNNMPATACVNGAYLMASAFYRTDQ